MKKNSKVRISEIIRYDLTTSNAILYNEKNEEIYIFNDSATVMFKIIIDCFNMSSNEIRIDDLINLFCLKYTSKGASTKQIETDAIELIDKMFDLKILLSE